MPFTEQGYETRRFNTLLEDLRQTLENELGTPISSNPDTVIGILNGIISNQLSIVENNTQALSNSLDIYKAEGVYLDRLVRYIGLTRLDKVAAKGLLKITRNSSTDVTGSLLFSTDTGVQFVTTEVISTKPEKCVDISLSPVGLVEGRIYSLTVQDADFTYTLQSNDTLQTLVNYFATQINNVLSLTTSSNDGKLFISVSDNDINGLKVESLRNLSIEEISSYISSESVLEGFIQVAPNSITKLVSNNNTVVSVNNPLDFINGRDLETDEELRARYELSFSQGGNTTFDNILGSLLQLPNVTDAVILENSTAAQSGDLPPKSYQCIVVDGNPINIANTIWETKPIGVETYGDITTLVTDSKGNTQSVKWSRPEVLYIFVEVTYSIYDEESFPSNGEALIKQAVTEYGKTLNLGEDVIPNRFIGGIYRTVSGIDNITIRVGKTTDVNATSPTGGYQTSRLAISDLELPFFTNSRVEVDI